MKVLLTGIFTTRKDNELVIYNQIKFTTNLLLEKNIWNILLSHSHSSLSPDSRRNELEVLQSYRWGILEILSV